MGAQNGRNIAATISILIFYYFFLSRAFDIFRAYTDQSNDITIVLISLTLLAREGRVAVQHFELD